LVLLFAEGARFQVRGGDRTIWLAEDAIWITVVEQTPPPAPPRHGEGSLAPSLVSGEGWGGGRKGAGRAGQPRKGVNLRVSFVGANPHPRLEPFNCLDTVVSYFIGNDPDQWHPDVPVWGGVRYVDLYPGIDLEITGEHGRLVVRTPTPALPLPGRGRGRGCAPED